MASSSKGREPHLNAAPRSADETTRVAAVVTPAPESPERFESRPGGATTPLHDMLITQSGFAIAPSANITSDQGLDFITGAQVFERLWVSAPSSTQASDGLGPIYNTRACAACHPGGGRGAAPGEGSGTTLRLALPDSDPLDPELAAYLEVTPEPTYGVQLQDRSTSDVPPEGQMQVRYTKRYVILSGGEVATLHAPTYSISETAYGNLHTQVQLSPRTAPVLYGMGLLEAIPEADILANADPDDEDGDGISGRPNWVFSRAHGQVMLGRFGLKAAEPTVLDQTAAAFHRDMGLSTRLYPEGYGPCTEAQKDCRAAPNGNTDRLGGVEVADGMLDLAVFYTSNLAPPARKGLDDPQVVRGKAVFQETRCSACHTPKFVTHRLPDRPEHSFQLIWPMTDLLLHDMGEGLADNRREFGATGQEWRTAPLWGLGARAPQRYLHDSRAQSVLEAILWHGGEAAPQAEAVRTMSPEDRSALIAYLESL